MGAEVLLRDVPIERLNNKTILLTGATGLIGTHLIRSFRYMYDMGVNLRVIAIGAHYPTTYSAALLNEPFVDFCFMDLATASVTPYFNNVDIIIHAASYGQPSKFLDQPEATMRLNTSLVLDLIKKIPIDGKFLFLSSSEIYSGLDKIPFNEDVVGTTNPEHPRACYIEAKRCGEAIVNIYREKGMDAKSVRIALTYGEGTRKDDERVLNVFIKKALLEKKIAMKDRGQAIRTYCYVEDSVNMMLKILLEGNSAVYNVGGVHSLNIAALASIIAKLTGTVVEYPRYDMGLSDAPNVVKMSIQRYINEFGEREFVSVEEGLRRTINYYKALYNDGKR